MSARNASCSCGQLRLQVSGDPLRVGICHCLACQQRTGSVFGAQARFPETGVKVSGKFREYVRHSDEAGDERRFRFCPECGATVFYTTIREPGLIAVPVGVFCDPDFPPPTTSTYDERRHAWVELPDEVERDDAWRSLLPLYQAGRFEEAADRGRELVTAHPTYTELLYNVACCESMAGRAEDAIGHLRRAIDRRADFRQLAAEDSDLDPIRDQPAFKELMGRAMRRPSPSG